jgi:hypothetical protein
MQLTDVRKPFPQNTGLTGTLTKSSAFFFVAEKK